jgi:hypothetical protein
MKNLTLVLLPGMDGTGLLFGPFLSEMRNKINFEVISYPPDRILTYTELVADVKSKLPTKGHWLLLAESFSGPVGIKVLDSIRHKPLALLLCSSFAKSPVNSPSTLLLNLVSNLLFKVKPPRLVVENFLLGKSANDELIELFYTAIKLVKPDVLAHRLKEILAVDVSVELRRFDVPIFYLQALQDSLVSAQSAEYICKNNSLVTLTKIVGPHLILQRNPSEGSIWLFDIVKKLLIK